MNSYSIRSIGEDSQGRLLVGSNDRGVFYAEGREFVQPESAKGEETKYLPVRCLAPDGRDRMWLGTGDGLAYVEDNQVCGFDLSQFGIDNLDNSTVYTLSLDENGIMWAVDNYGALLGIDTNDDSLKYCFKPGELWPEDMYVYSAAASRYGAVYAGTGGVILRMAADTVDKNKIFVSCGNDMFYGDNKGFELCTTFKTSSGSYLDIFPEGDNVWLFRASGILRCDRGNLIKGEKDAKPVLFVNSGDGVPGPVTANSFSNFEDGTFAICTVNGVGILDTADIYHDDVKPKGAVSDIIFSDGSSWEGEDEIKLNKNLSRMTLYLSALTFCDDDAYVEYWLEGFDDEPILKEISLQNEVEYTNLAAGKYTFHLRVINSDGAKGEELLISFDKSPRFTETIWFVLLVILIIVAVVWAVMRIRLHNARRKQEEYRKITDETISTMSGAIDAKDPYTQGHSCHVAEYSVAIGKELGLKEEETERLRYIALLHDIGKIGVPDDILKKPDRLTDDEFEIIKLHTSAGGEILKNFKMLPGVAEGALYHHEKCDGSGYCYNLKGKDIPLFARIIAVADAYDAMNSSRCYRKALDREIITGEIEEGKGKQFDPALADIALKLIREGRFDEEIDK